MNKICPVLLPLYAAPVPRPELGTLPDLTSVPELALFNPASRSQTGLKNLTIVATAPQRWPSPEGPYTANEHSAQPQLSQYNPMAALPPKLAIKIWTFARCLAGPPPWGTITTWIRTPHSPPNCDIVTWVECFACMAAMLCTKHTKKATESWAVYQTSILRPAENFEGLNWVAYYRQY